MLNLLFKKLGFGSINKSSATEDKINYYLSSNKYQIKSKVVDVDEESSEQLETVINYVYDIQTGELVDTFTTYN